MHALTYASYKYERWGGFLLFGNKQFAVGCGLDALLAGPMVMPAPIGYTEDAACIWHSTKAFHCLGARKFAISDDLLALMLISCGFCAWGDSRKGPETKSGRDFTWQLLILAWIATWFGGFGWIESACSDLCVL